MEEQRCKTHLANPLSLVAGILTCSLCGPMVPTPKTKDNTEFSRITCTLCGIVKNRKKTEGYSYVDEKGNKWLRKRCPDCKPIKILEQNSKRPRKLKKRTCISCKVPFQPKNLRHVYCVPNCSK